jgi:hypothetical protein
MVVPAIGARLTRRGIPRKGRSCPTKQLVAAGVILRGNQDQARAGRFGPGSAAEGVEDADDSGIGGENAQAYGRDHGDE